MEHDLSPRESRRLVRQFLRLDRRAPTVALFSSNPSARSGLRRLPRPDRRVGPYEADDSTVDGYVIERTIIVP